MVRLSVLALAAGVAARGRKKPSDYDSDNKFTFDNFVTFGDSYTDETRLSYFINNNGSAPPPGLLLPETNTSASGGYAWGRLVANLAGAKYYDYAVAGATCSNKIIERNFEYIHQPFPDVMGYEIPAFKADLAYVNSTTGTNTLYPDLTAANTVYALWIGTNDLGQGAFLTDSQAPGTTIADFTDCVWEVFDNIYETGGRRFVVLNQAPLEVSPIYADPKSGGTLDNKFWTNKTSYNMTEYEQKILEYTTLVNTVFDYGVPFYTAIQDRWPGAEFSVFNVHDLLMDIHDNPEQYLDSPANVTGYYYVCDGEDFTNCYTSENDLSTFLWYDELHPAERPEEIIAASFMDVLAGNSSYGVTYTSK